MTEDTIEIPKGYRWTTLGGLPEKWEHLSFSIIFRGRILTISITGREAEVKLNHGDALQVEVNGKIVYCQQDK